MKKMMTELSIRVLGFREDDQWCALALEMDLRGYGDTFEEAEADLQKAVAMQLSFAIHKEKFEMALFPAEQKYFKIYNDIFGKKVFATITRSNAFDVGSEYGLSEMPIQRVAESGDLREGMYAEAKAI